MPLPLPVRARAGIRARTRVRDGHAGRARAGRRATPVGALAPLVVLLLGAGALAACSGDDGGAGTSPSSVSGPTDESAPPTSTTSEPPASTTSVPVSSSIGAPGLVEDCAVLAPIPADATHRSSFEADLDDDGQADQLDSYAIGAEPGAGDWHLRATLAAGGGSDLTLREDPAPGLLQVLGTVYIGSTVEPGPGGRRPAILVWTGSGASARTIGLYRVDGCELAAMTSPAGGPAGFVVGASVGHQEGLRCEGTAGTSLLVEVLSEPDAGGSGYAVTRRAYSREGNGLVVEGQPQVATEPAPPVEAGQIVGCGDIVAPR